MQTKTITYKNATVFYRVTGEGRTVVLLHGFGEDGTVWQQQIDFLKANFRLIVPNIPGSGQSHLIENANIDTYAEVIKKILDAEIKKPLLQETDRVSLIGHSMGGYIALAFAEKYPEYLKQLGLFHSTAFADSNEKKDVRRKSIEFIRTKGAFEFLKTSIPSLFGKTFTTQYPDKILELIHEAKNFTEGALTQYYEAMITRPDRIHVLQNFERPVLFIMGEYDLAVPLQSSLQQCHLPLRSYVHILNQSGHMGMWEEKERANDLLFKFLVNKF